MDKKRGMLSRLRPEDKKTVIESVIAYFAREKDEEIGVIAAEEMVDYILEQVEAKIYNQGLDDATKKMRDEFDRVLAEIELTMRVKE